MDNVTTTHIPLQSGLPSTSHPTFVKPSAHPDIHLESVTSAIAQAKCVVVICGAGISVGAGIPDFRSRNGLFNTLKRNNVGAGLSSGKDLFHARVFESRANTSLFNIMIGNLAQLAESAQPTPFHLLLKTLEDRGSLLRVYTQNIDCLEERAGLTFGLPVWEARKKGAKGKAHASQHVATNNGLLTPPPSQRPTASPAESDDGDETPPIDTPGAGPSSISSSIPRCIPLHGHVKSLYCSLCFHSTALLPHVDQLVAGNSVPCPSCEDLESTRRLVGKRERGVGQMRPSVVLYGESHREGEIIGESVKRDLLGKQRAGSVGDNENPTKASSSTARSSNARPDLLIVAGTSLKIPGTKRLVREFSKAARTSTRVSNSPSDGPTPVKTIFLNFEFPVPARQWEGVFDTWLQGDVQTFAAGASLQVKRYDEKVARVAIAAALKRSQISSSSPKKPLSMEPCGHHIITTTTAKKRKGTVAGDTPVASVPKKKRVVKVVEVVIDVHPGPKSSSAQLVGTKALPIKTISGLVSPRRTLVPLMKPSRSYSSGPAMSGIPLRTTMAASSDTSYLLPSNPQVSPVSPQSALHSFVEYPNTQASSSGTGIVDCMRNVTLGWRAYGDTTTTAHAS
ncbi:hypothetical protein FRB96_003472 [Tulasnella sp. 330]|nr:hypothetical protein FRB96_003472 [Tulasnella sp. 330]